MTWITTADDCAVHAAAMSNTYTIEMVEFTAGKALAFAPSFGAFRTLHAAVQAATLRIALSAPRVNPVGYRIFDRERRQVRCWPAAA